MSTTNPKTDTFDTLWDAMPEDKLELLDGQLIINNLTGSRRIMWMLLQDYGPEYVLSMAAPELWWSALQAAYNPQPPSQTPPQTPDEWRTWADELAYEPEVVPMDLSGWGKHRKIYEILRWSLYYRGSTHQLGQQLGRDFVIRLGEDGPTPDLVFIDRARLANLRDRYLDGPPAIVIEITMGGTEDQERVVKRKLYEQGGVPEYWLIEPEGLKITIYRLRPNGRYDPLEIGPHELANAVKTKEDIIYHSEAVPELSLSLMDLWTMEEHDWEKRWRPFLPIGTSPDDGPLPKGSEDGIGWDDIPFAPRVGLHPVPIRFAEFASWSGRAKFEHYGGGLKIDGSEGARRVAGMLLMTFGLIEVVKLVHPREWVTFLDPTPYQTTVKQQTEVFMQQAQYKPGRLGKDEYHVGEIPGLADVSGYGDTMAECEADLLNAVRGWILLRLARREPIVTQDEGK